MADYNQGGRVNYIGGMAMPPDAHRHQEWCNRGCHSMVPAAYSKLHDDFHNAITYRKDGNVSNVLWCDPGDHAFKAGTPGAINFQGTQNDEDGRVQQTSIDACAKHNPFRTDPEHIRKELLSEYPVPDNGNAV